MENERKGKVDCFAYPELGKSECYCLKECYCKKEECKFYKTKEEVNKSDLERAVRRYSLVGNKEE